MDDENEKLEPGKNGRSWIATERGGGFCPHISDAPRQNGLTYSVEPQKPADLLGIFVLLPAL